VPHSYQPYLRDITLITLKYPDHQRRRTGTTAEHHAVPLLHPRAATSLEPQTVRLSYLTVRELLLHMKDLLLAHHRDKHIWAAYAELYLRGLLMADGMQHALLYEHNEMLEHPDISSLHHEIIRRTLRPSCSLRDIFKSEYLRLCHLSREVYDFGGEVEFRPFLDVKYCILKIFRAAVNVDSPEIV
jgi:hypothetical protein